MTVVLAIDTAAPRLQLALQRGNGDVDKVVEDMPQGQAERIFPAIGELLLRNGVGYSELDRIAVTTGPGSFTGLRIGLSAARGLGLALGVPVIGIPSLLAISLGAEAQPTAVLLDARRGEAYVQVFGTGESRPQVLATAEAEALIPHGSRPITSPYPDIAAVARFAAEADPSRYPPDPLYIRGADAKPQDGARIARVPAQ